MLILFAICFILARASAGPGACPDAQPMDNFDFNSYAQGRWFEIARYAGLSLENGADCVFFDYATKGNDMICTLREIVDKKENTLSTIVKMSPDAGKKAKLFYSAHKKLENVTVYILDTDYNNYAIFYYCIANDATQTPVELAWIKSRNPSLSPESKTKVDKFIEAHPLLDTKKFQWDHFTHDDCLIDV